MTIHKQNVKLWHEKAKEANIKGVDSETVYRVRGTPKNGLRLVFTSLSVYIDCHLNWKYHVNELSTKLFFSRPFGMLANIRHYVCYL